MTATKHTVDSLVRIGDLLGPSKIPEQQRRENYTAYALLESKETLEEARTNGLTFEHWKQLQDRFNHAYVVVGAWMSSPTLDSLN